jgi:hypothetical protein
MGKAIVTSNDSGESDVTPTESKTTGTVGNFAHGSRETPETSVSLREADRSEKARGHNSDMHAEGEKAFEINVFFPDRGYALANRGDGRDEFSQ